MVRDGAAVTKCIDPREPMNFFELSSQSAMKDARKVTTTTDLVHHRFMNSGG